MLEKNPHFAERWTSSPPQPHTFHVNVINDDASRRPPPTAEGARQRRGDKRSKRLAARTRKASGKLQEQKPAQNGACPSFTAIVF
jgi:hypothetical protein